MAHLQRERVEERAGEIDALAALAREVQRAAVRLVAEERTAERAQVQADLVRAARLGKSGDERGAGEALQDLEARARGPRLDRLVDDALVARRLAEDERAVLLHRAVLAEFGQERRLRAARARQQRHAGRAAVEAMDEERLR